MWDIVRTLVDQREAREIDPTLTVLRELQMDADFQSSSDHTKQRIEKTTEMIELLTQWYDEMRLVDSKRLEQLLKMGAAAQKVLDFKDKVIRKGGN